MNADERRWTEWTDQSGACPVVRGWSGILKPHGASAFIGVHLRLKIPCFSGLARWSEAPGSALHELTQLRRHATDFAIGAIAFQDSASRLNRQALSWRLCTKILFGWMRADPGPAARRYQRLRCEAACDLLRTVTSATTGDASIRPTMTGHRSGSARATWRPAEAPRSQLRTARNDR